jgi:hypothetical protein
MLWKVWCEVASHAHLFQYRPTMSNICITQSRTHSRTKSRWCHDESGRLRWIWDLLEDFNHPVVSMSDCHCVRPQPYRQPSIPQGSLRKLHSARHCNIEAGSHNPIIARLYPSAVSLCYGEVVLKLNHTQDRISQVFTVNSPYIFPCMSNRFNMFHGDLTKTISFTPSLTSYSTKPKLPATWRYHWSPLK